MALVAEAVRGVVLEAGERGAEDGEGVVDCLTDWMMGCLGYKRRFDVTALDVGLADRDGR